MKQVILLFIAFCVLSCNQKKQKTSTKSPKIEKTTIDSEMLLLVNYELKNMSLEEHAALGNAVAPDFSPENIKGLIGKTFIGNIDSGVFGGIYYFENKEFLDSYLNSELFKGVMAHSNLVNFTNISYNIAPISSVTNGIASDRKTSSEPLVAANMKMLLVNYELKEMTLEEHAALGSAVASDFSPENIEGLIGKTFIGNVDTGVFGGVYYFQTQEALDNYLNSELYKGITAHPNLVHFTTSQYIVAPVSAVTNGIPAL
ncbi:MAG: YdhR family protein [Polaribacter sp.]|nr:YdhR family protein [Polaribacter sp.]